MQMKALKNELMQELKKSRDEAQQLRQTVEEQQKQFGAQQDIITRQQAQIQGLIVAKEAAEVARQKQEINLIEAKRETEKAIDDGKEKEQKALRLAQLVESRRKEANEEARLLRKRAAQLLTGASLSTGAAFYEAMQRRKQLERDTGVAKAVDDLDDLIEALQTDDIESGISRPTTAREAGDEYDSEEDEAVEHAALVGRGGSGEEEEEAEEEEEGEEEEEERPRLDPTEEDDNELPLLLLLDSGSSCILLIFPNSLAINSFSSDNSRCTLFMVTTLSLYVSSSV